MLTNPSEISMDIGIGVPKDLNAKAFQVAVPLAVMRRPLIFIMLRAIQLHNNLCAVTIKIRYIMANDLLTIDRNGYLFEEIIPQMALLFGHISPEILCVFLSFPFLGNCISPTSFFQNSRVF